MKSILPTVVFFLTAFVAFSQEGINKTDSQGLKQGRWMGRYPSGSLRYEGAFDHNKPVGEWKRYHENGKIKALMSYRPHSERVSASLFDEEGILYARGVFEGMLRDSTWNFFKGEKLVRTENYISGKREGKATAFDPDGKVISEKMWKNDLPEGISTEYYPTGKKRNEVAYIAGKKTGKALFYNENGGISMEGNYLGDLSDGDWKVYGNDGKLLYEIQYAKGEILNKGELDSLVVKESKQLDKARGTISEPKINEQGLP